MDREEFEQLVARAVENLPEEFRARLENIDVVVAESPTRHQLLKLDRRHDEALLGLYEGVPLTRRTQNYGMVTPDKITIFQKPIESICRSHSEIIKEVQQVVRHEIAHHFGISDARLKQLGLE